MRQKLFLLASIAALAVAAWLFPSAVYATTYYLRTDGHDGAGVAGTANTNHATTGAFLTLSYSLSRCVAGDTVRVVAGTYAESSGGLGCLWLGTSGITCAFASDVTVMSDAGVAADVIITNATSGAYAALFVCYIRQGTSHVKFQNVTFQSNAAQAVGTIIQGADATYITLDGCLVKGVQGESGLLSWAPGTGTTASNITIQNCTFSQTGTSAITGISFLRAASTTTLNAVTVKNTSVTTKGLPGAFNGVTNLVLGDATVGSGGVFVCTGTAIALSLGGDSSPGSGVTTTGTAKNFIARAASSHGLLIGLSVTDVAVSKCEIYGGDYGAVIKENTGAAFTDSVVFGGTLSSVYFKGAANAIVRNNDIIGTKSSAIKVGVGDAIKCEDNSITMNRIYTIAGTPVFDWGDSDNDAGGNVCNSNTYICGTVNWGTVYGVAITGTGIADLRAAWAGYDVTTNDGGSRRINRVILANPVIGGGAAKIGTQ